MTLAELLIEAADGRFDVRAAPFVPLSRTDADGTKHDALCWLVDGVVLVHPDRWDLFWQCMSRAIDARLDAILKGSQ